MNIICKSILSKDGIYKVASFEHKEGDIFFNTLSGESILLRNCFMDCKSLYDQQMRFLTEDNKIIILRPIDVDKVSMASLDVFYSDIMKVLKRKYEEIIT